MNVNSVNVTKTANPVLINAPIHIENQYVYPSSVEVENDMVEWEHDILFDIFTETVTIRGNYDSLGITLIHERMKELNFN